MRIDVIGGYGVIGTEMQARRFMAGHEVAYYNRQALDIMKDFDKIRQLNSDLIINLAVDKNPENIYTSVNSLGVKNLRENTDIKILHLSTDYVFDGKRGHYSFDDHVCAINNYGASKILGENELSDNDIIVRTSWIMSKNGGFYKKIADKMLTQSKIEVVCNRYGSPTSAAYLIKYIELVCQDILVGRSASQSLSLYDLFRKQINHCVNLGVASWFDVACEIAKIEKYHGEIVPIAYEKTTQDMPRPINTSLRPSFSLAKQSSWQEALWQL